MTPRNPEFAAATRAALDSQPFSLLLGMTVGEIAPGAVDLHLLPDQRHLQHDGLVHGGVLATLADTGGAMAAHTLMAAHERVVTVEFKISYLRPAGADPLICRGRVLRPGKTITTSEADIVAVRGSQYILIARALLTAATVLPPE